MRPLEISLNQPQLSQFISQYIPHSGLKYLFRTQYENASLNLLTILNSTLFLFNNPWVPPPEDIKYIPLLCLALYQWYNPIDAIMIPIDCLTELDYQWEKVKAILDFNRSRNLSWIKQVYLVAQDKLGSNPKLAFLATWYLVNAPQRLRCLQKKSINNNLELLKRYCDFLIIAKHLIKSATAEVKKASPQPNLSIVI